MKSDDETPLSHEPPDWMIREMQSEPDPELIKHYEHLRSAIREGIEHWSRDEQRARAADRPNPLLAIFTTAGEIIKVLVDSVDQLFPRLVPATRGIAGAATQPPANATSLLSSIATMAGDVQIRTEWHKGQDGLPEIRVFAFDRNSSPVVPLKIVVRDEAGAELAAIEVLNPAETPRFPQPSPGTYIFNLSWLGHTASIAIEVRERQST